jgi:hypothetical protein
VEQKDGVDEMLSDVQIDVRDLLCVFSHYPFRFSALSGQVWRSELNIGVDNELKLLQTYNINKKVERNTICSCDDADPSMF